MLFQPIEIDCPIRDRLRDTALTLLGIPRKWDSGFSPVIPDTLIENVIDQSGEGLGPISLSCSPLRLMILAYKTNADRFGAMIISGGSVTRSLHSTRGDIAQGSFIASIVNDCGLDKVHLTSIVTPRLMLNQMEYPKLGLAEHYLIKRISHLVQERAFYEKPEITTNRIYLRGWRNDPATIPSCIVATTPRNSAMELEIRWGERRGQRFLVRLI